MHPQEKIGEGRHVKTCHLQGRGVLLVAVLGALSIWADFSHGQTPGAARDPNKIHLQQIKGGPVSILKKGATTPVPTQVEQDLEPGDRVLTGPNTHASLLWSDQSVVPIDELTELEILPPRDPKDQFGLNLIKGIISFFHRSNEPGRIHIITHAVMAGVVGTEFVLEVDTRGPTERTILSVVDGMVLFSNDFGNLVLTNNQESFATVGSAPSPPVGFTANNRLQWCFYYPGVLDLRDLPLTPAEETALADSLRAYRLGDLLGALRLYPAGRQPGSDAERVYYAAVQLAVGRVSQTETILAGLPVGGPDDRIQRLATALRVLIAAVRREDNPSSRAPELSTELVAASYYEQSLAVREESLEAALKLALQAANTSPAFGFAWERVAELEFSFGRVDRATRAFEKSYALSPRNAEALALQGFLLAAQNRTKEAIVWFNFAIEADSSLGNAWLGRGLCRIHRGDLDGGSKDLLMAAALEPQRALLRSYLGKAYAEKHDYARAAKELDRAKYLDPHDPTSWLYSALLNQEHNRINEAIRDLEQSQDLNDNRSVYRSGLLLDQDRAVRSANLAAIYRDAGMIDFSAREASRAVSYDYANYSAHLFLANSFDQLRDPNRINLRYETPAVNEYLIANLLAPVQAGSLSPTISQQEYSRLFERDGFRRDSSTEYLSRGAWSQNAAQSGIFGDTSYDLEVLYRSDPGQRPNNDFTEKGVSFQIKQQVAPHDTVFFQGSYYDAAGGDLTQYYYQNNANLGLRTTEKQDPILLGGWHHEWNPGLHTLLLAGRLADTINVDNPAQQTYWVFRDPIMGIEGVQPMTIPQMYRSSLEIYSVELQQIWQGPLHNTVIGGRFQTGDFETRNIQTVPSISDNLESFFPPDIAADQHETTDLERFTFYAYHTQSFFERLQLTAGLAYDRLTFPENFRAAPINGANKTEDQLGPKAGIIWTPTDSTIVRAAFSRSLGGASFDQSFRLEPSTVAGFLQSFRSIIPESVGGAEAGAEFETWGLSLEQRFSSGTYLGLTAERLNSTVDRTVGVFVYNGTGTSKPGSLDEHLDYTEKALVFTVDQLIGAQCSVGVRYRLSRSDLEDKFPELTPLPPSAFLPPFTPAQQLEATLHQVNLYAVFNHPSGLFARIEGLWNGQSNSGYSPELPGSYFWQVNAFAGYRFLHRRAEITLGLLNLSDQNYELNPLTLFNDLPRSRTLSLRLRLDF